MVTELVSWSNTTGGTKNSYLELNGSVLHHDGVAILFDVRERKVLYRTDKMSTMWWQHKGYATSTSAPTHFLRTQDLQQRFHHYVPWHEFVRGKENDISDLPSNSTHPTDARILQYFSTHSPQTLLWKMWTPSINIV